VKRKKLGYKRKIKKRTKDYEVVLITWSPGAKSSLHGHGKSHGIILVRKGQISEQLYTKAGKHLRNDIHKAGDIIVETPCDFHIMRNASKTERAQTLHIYMPPLKN